MLHKLERETFAQGVDDGALSRRSAGLGLFSILLGAGAMPQPAHADDPTAVAYVSFAPMPACLLTDNQHYP